MEHTKYYIAISLKLDIAADAFAVAWNKDPACREMGKALVPKGPIPEPFIPFAQQASVMLMGVVGPMILDPLKDMIKERVKAYLDQCLPKPTSPIEVIQVRQPDGGILLVVQEVE